MILIAFDPSINNVGWAKKQMDTGAVEWGTIKTPADSTDASKLSFISNHVLDLISPGRTIAVVEDSRSGSFARSRNQWGKDLNLASLKKLHMALGTILATLASHGVDVSTVFPEQYKTYTSGRRRVCMSEDQVMQLVRSSREGRINEHEAHALLMLGWKEQQWRYEKAGGRNQRR